MTEALVTIFFCLSEVPRELHSDQDHNLESHLIWEVLQRLGVDKTRITPLYTQSNATMERYLKTTEE